jgi:predicted Zn finger-like uncharacterized protein
MLLTCPHCTTIFRIAPEQLHPAGQTVRCSLCHHMWTAHRPAPQAPDDGAFVWHRLQAAWKPVFISIFLLGFVTAIIAFRATVTAYMPVLINGFDNLGLTIRPVLTQLQVVDLNASYSGDTLRLSGGLRNTGYWRSHAADLRVTVRSGDGVIINETLLRPETDIIAGSAASGFFTQLTLEAAQEVQVTVTPLANRVYR